MIRALVVDDERLARQELRMLLAQSGRADVIGEAATIPEARTLLARTDPDVVFLDIRLGRTSGFDLVEDIPDRSAIVFVTAYDEHAIRAFDAKALDYLLKPVEPPRLLRTLQRLEPAPVVPASHAAPGHRGQLADADWLFLPVANRQTFVRLRDVTHLVADGDYVVVHTVDGRAIRSSHSLSHWEQRLPASFLRIHRRTVIHLDFVTGVEPWSHYSYLVSLRGVAQPVSMSRRFARRVRAVLG